GYPGAGPSDSRWQPGFLLCRTRSALTRHRHNHITLQALGLVDIRVPDHLIVGGSQVFSFAEHGLL
ncbi:JAB domain-containing protein, partial [Escherichia coli]|uniref:JAB domain-containing protein n=1 Tax=Escherichia coli TaxID=562 RepID=UPI003CC9137B